MQFWRRISWFFSYLVRQVMSWELSKAALFLTFSGFILVIHAAIPAVHENDSLQ